MDIKNFDNFKVSTKTFIVHTNLEINIEDIFNKKILPITSYVVIQKKRGRKKKLQEENPNKDIQTGSIIRVQYKRDHQGVILKPKKSDGFFRNAMTIVMVIDDKHINFKTSNNGKFQITGCKTDDQAEKCIFHFWNYIKDHKDMYKLSAYPHFKACYEPVMSNIDFSLGFQVNREVLDIYINTNTTFTSLLETTFGYTGVNIKMPLSEDFSKLKIKCIEYNGEEIKNTFNSYDEFLLTFKSKNKNIKRYNTFLVFQSGKIIMSGKAPPFMESAYYEFYKIVESCLHLIKENIED